MHREVVTGPQDNVVVRGLILSPVLVLGAPMKNSGSIPSTPPSSPSALSQRARNQDPSFLFEFLVTGQIRNGGRRRQENVPRILRDCGLSTRLGEMVMCREAVRTPAALRRTDSGGCQ